MWPSGGKGGSVRAADMCVGRCVSFYATGVTEQNSVLTSSSAVAKRPRVLRVR